MDLLRIDLGHLDCLWVLSAGVTRRVEAFYHDPVSHRGGIRLFYGTIVVLYGFWWIFSFSSHLLDDSGVRMDEKCSDCAPGGLFYGTGSCSMSESPCHCHINRIAFPFDPWICAFLDSGRTARHSCWNHWHTFCRHKGNGLYSAEHHNQS